MHDPSDLLVGLPGASLVSTGLQRAKQGTWTVEALVVAVAATRLNALGLEVPPPPDDPELRLYDRLREEHPDDPYARYNSLLRELDSFLEALESRRRRERGAA